MADAPDALRTALEDRLRFESLLADLSSQFVNLDPAHLDEAIVDALRRVVETLGFDRSTVLRLDGDGHVRTTHAWARAGMDAPPIDVSRFEWLRPRLLAGELVSFASPDELPSPDREAMIEIGTRSNVIVPLILSGRVVGVLTFASVQQSRRWPDEILQRFRLVAQTFAAALARQHAEADLQRAASERIAFEALIADVVSRFVNLDSSEIDGAVEHAQERIALALDLDRSTLYQFAPDGAIRVTHSWVRPEFADLGPTIRGYRFARYPNTVAALLQGKVVVTSSIDELPPDSPDLRQYIETGTKASVAVPMVVSDRVIGALTFAAHREARRWPPEIVNRLTLVGQVFSAALSRQRTERDLRATMEENARLRERLTQENVYLQRAIKERDGVSEITGGSAAIQRLLAEVDQVANTPATVLILGETGAGKELIASAIHERSARRARPMVRVNCAAIPAALIESELFGREKGAYTGAAARQIGRFEVADGSTIFLDEIGELALDVQVKLLRVLQERQIERLGSSRPIDVDVRIIAATNRDLDRAVAEGVFREDLYYRLNVFPVHVPPLRDRPEDIPVLVWAFVEEFARALGRRIESISREQMRALQEYAWPGNVRELRNVVERAVIVATGPRLHIEPPRRAPAGRTRSVRLDDVERDHILAVLERARWRIRGNGGAAEILGLKPSTLESRMIKLDIRRPGA